MDAISALTTPPIKTLKLPPVIERRLFAAAIEFVGDFQYFSAVDLLRIQGIGLAEVGKIACVLANHGISLPPRRDAPSTLASPTASV